MLVTGGAGFIGSALVHRLVAAGNRVVNVDCLTYAGNLRSLDGLADDSRHVLEQVDIANGSAVGEIFHRHQPRTVFHLAAESHVDRSIEDPDRFIHTNVLGTLHLLQAAHAWCEQGGDRARAAFRFVHVSTDEVFGSLPETGSFTSTTAYDPSSPYSASKAGADHLARAWHRTYGLPVIVTNCSNNYGPRQHPEKLIPRIILSALHGMRLPVYGDGRNVRDWLHVEDHVAGLLAAARRGVPGETYLFGGGEERQNLDVVRAICGVLDRVRPDPQGPHERLIRFVADRPGHDFRYAIDATSARHALGWAASRSFSDGILQTVLWYLANPDWWRSQWGELMDGGVARAPAPGSRP